MTFMKFYDFGLIFARRRLQYIFFAPGEYNFTQKDPILAANDPFGKNFDASMVWGPVIGRMVYVGMRYKIK